MTSNENRTVLQRAGGQYILGEKLSGNHLSEAALSHPGRFKVLDDNLHIKEAFVGEGVGKRRYVIVCNPKQAEADRVNRQQIPDRLGCELEALNKKRKTKAQCKSVLHRSMGRYVKELKNGKLKIDMAKVRQAEKLDGKYLLSSSDESLSPEEIARGYKQLLEVERAFRTLKSSLNLRPVYHSKDDRIRSHVLICWMALLLVRISEVETGLTWSKIRHEMQQLHLGKFLTKKSRILQHAELTKNKENILKLLKIKPPKRILNIKIKP